MQKITEKLKNTPGDVQSLLVPCSVSSLLNRVEKLSVKDKVLSVINPEGVQPEYTQGLKANYVYVLFVDVLKNSVEKIRGEDRWH